MGKRVGAGKEIRGGEELDGGEVKTKSSMFHVLPHSLTLLDLGSMVGWMGSHQQ